MDNLFIKLFNISVTASFVVLAVILVRFLTKKAPRFITCILWGLVGIRLVMPFSIESVLSLIPSKETLPQDIMITHTPEIHSGIPVINSYINPIISETFKPDVAASANPMQIIIFVASIIWLTGIAVMLIYSVVSYFYLKHKVSASVIEASNIYYCDAVKSPFILGIIKPKIYLPSDIQNDSYEYVIAHEKAHIKRLDHIWKPLAFLILSIYWYNPILWLSYILFCRDIETACDQKVIKTMNTEEIKGYSTALLNFSAIKKPITACPLAFGEVGVKNRIKAILNYKKPAFWIIIISIILAVAIAVCFLTVPKDKPKTESHLPTAENLTCFSPYRLDYNNGMYSYVPPIETFLCYCLDNDLNLYTIDSNNLVTSLGKMEEITLDTENFDSRLTQNFWLTKFSTKGFRQDNKRAFTLKVENNSEKDDEVYLLLEQENGDYYMAIGYYDMNLVEPTNKDKSLIRWIFKVNPSKNKNTYLQTQNSHIDGRVFYYKEPTYEHANPEIVRYNDFEKSELEKLLKQMKKLKWVDDSLTDRISFNFDGYLFYDGYKIFFGYEQNVVFCNGYFADIKDNLLEPIKILRKTAKENIFTKSQVYYYEKTDSYGGFYPVLSLDYLNNSFTFSVSPLSSYLSIGKFELKDDILTCKTNDGAYTYVFKKQDDSLYFDSQKSSNVRLYDKSGKGSTLADESLFRLRVNTETNGNIESITHYD